MRRKAVKTIGNINNTFGPVTATKSTAVVVVQEVCKGDESREDAECGGRPLGGDSGHLRAVAEADPLQLLSRLPKNSAWTIL